MYIFDVQNKLTWQALEIKVILNEFFINFTKKFVPLFFSITNKLKIFNWKYIQQKRTRKPQNQEIHDCLSSSELLREMILYSQRDNKKKGNDWRNWLCNCGFYTNLLMESISSSSSSSSSSWTCASIRSLLKKGEEQLTLFLFFFSFPPNSLKEREKRLNKIS